jgi:hypothetical protein
LPYCTKCGTKLDEGVKYCYVCGTPVGVAAAARAPERRRRVRPSFLLPVVVLSAVILIALIAVAVLFVPLRPVNFSKAEEVTYRPGIDEVHLDFIADVGEINLSFRKQTATLLTLNVTATGAVGIGFPSSSDPLNVSFTNTFAGNALYVSSRVTLASGWRWTTGLNVRYDIVVDPSMNASILAKTTTGKVVFDAGAGVVLRYLELEAVTGGIEATIANNMIHNGYVSFKTTTGGIDLFWQNVDVTLNTPLNVKTTTGGINLNITQRDPMPANVTLNAEASTGGINFDVVIRRDVGCNIAAKTGVGGIDVNQVGFSGDTPPLHSDNYPDEGNFIVTLETSTGGINIDARYTP